MTYDFARTGLIVLGHPPKTKDPRTSMIVFDPELLESFLDGLTEPGYDPRKDPHIFINRVEDRRIFLGVCQRSIRMAQENRWVLIAIEREDGGSYEEPESLADPHVGGLVPTSSVWTYVSNNHQIAVGLN